MAAEINYKKKYLELRTKYMSDLDTAFRLGFEQGGQEAKQQQALDAQAKAEEMQQQQQLVEANAAGQPPGQPGAEGQPPQEGQAPQPGMEGQAPAPVASELDQHIGQLESMLGSSEQTPEIKKSLQAIVSLRKAEKLAVEMKKSELAIAGIAKALHKPAFKVSTQANANLTDSAKKAVTLQHKIVTDVMKTWKAEEERASKDIKAILNVENLSEE